MDESLRRSVTGNELAIPVASYFAIARQTLSAYWAESLGICILLAMSVNLIAVTARKTITADELVLIPAAYYHLVTDDIQLVAEHPPLCKLLAGVPLLFVQPNEPAASQINPTFTRGEREWFYAMRFWEDNRSRFETISFWARIPMIVLTIALGVLIFVFARDLFGPRAALLALAIFSLEPTVLAHGRVVQTDVPAAFGFLLATFALYRYLRVPGWKLAAYLGAAAGVAMLSKYSMIIVGPILLLVFLVLLWRRTTKRSTLAGHALVAAVTLLLVVNAGYFFYHRSLAPSDTQWIATSFPSSKTAVLTSVRTLKLVLPTDFVMGVYWQLHHSSEGHPAGLLGMYRQKGWWYYFPVAFALKTTLPFLLLTLSSLAWCVYRIIRKREWQLLVLLAPFAIYTAFVMMSPIDIGIRYYLPAYAFLFILSGGLLDSLIRKARLRRVHIGWASLVVVTLSWMVWEAGRAYPNYMAYMNQIASARPHWWYLSDSNVEWGDDVKELATYLRERGETRTRAMLLGGYVTLGFYGVEYLDALSPIQEPSPRYTVLGASFLNGSTVQFYQLDGKQVSNEQRVNTFDQFRHRTPEAVIGNSIYVYRMRD